MATLTCKDGTVIKISDETEAELRKAFEPKPEPRPTVTIGKLHRSAIGGAYDRIIINLPDVYLADDWKGHVIVFDAQGCKINSLIGDETELNKYYYDEREVL